MQSDLVFFGPAHLLMIALTFALPILVALMVKRLKISSLDNGLRWVMAVTLLGSKIATALISWHKGQITFANALPMHLCDWAMIAVILSLTLRGKQVIFELAYFWGLAGTLQGVLTPNLQVPSSDPRFYTFFIGHCGIIFGILYLVFSSGIIPRPGAWWKVWLMTQVYVAAAGVVDFLLNENYGYLNRKPNTASLLDFFGPWPWYVVEMDCFALLAFGIVYLPVALTRWINSPATADK